MKNLLRVGLGAVVVPASLPLVDVSPVQATDADSEGHLSTATVDPDTLGSCTANFSLTKQNSRLVSFEVKGSLASDAVVGEDLIPVWVYDDGGTTAHCRMEAAWNPEATAFIPTTVGSVDFSTFDFLSTPGAGILASDSVEAFWFDSPPGVVSAELDNLVTPVVRTQYLVPSPQVQDLGVATTGEDGHVLLVPVTAGVTEDSISYDPTVPTAVDYSFGLSPAPEQLAALLEEIERMMTDFFSGADSALRAEAAAYVASLRSGGIDCDNYPVSEEFALAFRESVANPVFWEGVQDANRVGDLYFASGFSSPTGACNTIFYLAQIGAAVNLSTDERVVEVTAGTLPATGFGATDTTALAVAALFAWVVITASQRRRPT